MYEATKSEREKLIEVYDYTHEAINKLDIASDKVRKGITIDFMLATIVCEYQSKLQRIRKSKKNWWQFWL